MIFVEVIFKTENINENHWEFSLKFSFFHTLYYIWDIIIVRSFEYVL